MAPEPPAGVLLGLILRSPDTETAIERLQARFELEESEARQVLTTPLDAFIGEARDRTPMQDASAADTAESNTWTVNPCFAPTAKL